MIEIASPHSFMFIMRQIFCNLSLRGLAMTMQCYLLFVEQPAYAESRGHTSLRDRWSLNIVTQNKIPQR